MAPRKTRAAKRRQNGHAPAVASAPSRTITFDDGKVRELRLDMNALVALEDQGINILDPSNLDITLTPSVLRKITWALLISDDPDLRIEQVGRWLHGRNLAESLRKVTAALDETRASLPKAGD